MGTQFLSGLLAAPDFFDRNCTSGYLAWNEHELPFIPNDPGDPIYNLSLSEYRAMMAYDNLPNNKVGNSNFNRFVVKGSGTWYGGQKIKQWNTEGNAAALRDYLQEQSIPALRSVYQRFNNQDDKPDEKLTHFIKNGHTAIFYNLSDYYDALSSTSLDDHHETRIEVDFVRIRRHRLEVANSFVSEPRLDPVAYGRKVNGIVTNPSMKTALLRFDSLGGPLPDQVYQNWTLFQKYLWFCDEVEARWRMFLKAHPEVKYYELDYTAGDRGHQKLDPSSIDDLALNFLEIGHPLSPYIKHISTKSHKKSARKAMNLSQQQKIEQAAEYAMQAPWCLQYDGATQISSEYPRLDCGISA